MFQRFIFGAITPIFVVVVAFVVVVVVLVVVVLVVVVLVVVATTILVVVAIAIVIAVVCIARYSVVHHTMDQDGWLPSIVPSLVVPTGMLIPTDSVGHIIDAKRSKGEFHGAFV